MIHENELIMLASGLGALAFVLANYSKLKQVPFSKIFLRGFYILLLGWVLTVLEGFFLSRVFNFLEHLCYAASAVVVAFWFWKGTPFSRSRQ
ncbi:MAG: hypothetical protein PVG49_14075 [Desulfobacteraceae bacterium]|jgi:hypothetical protein